MIDPFVTVVTITPSRTLIATLSEIGGLLVIFRFFILIFVFVHQKMFERKMRNDSNKSEGDDYDFKKVYSFENFNQALK